MRKGLQGWRPSYGGQGGCSEPVFSSLNDGRRSPSPSASHSEIERCVAAAAERPTPYSAVYNDVRRVVANRFPFSVYVRAEERRIVALAVFRGSRDPAICRQRTLQTTAEIPSSIATPNYRG